MRDYTLLVYTNPELTKWDEHVHVDVHAIRNGCLYIHFMGQTMATIIPTHAFYQVSVLED